MKNREECYAGKGLTQQFGHIVRSYHFLDTTEGV